MVRVGTSPSERPNRRTAGRGRRPPRGRPASASATARFALVSVLPIPPFGPSTQMSDLSAPAPAPARRCRRATAFSTAKRSCARHRRVSSPGADDEVVGSELEGVLPEPVGRARRARRSGARGSGGRPRGGTRAPARSPAGRRRSRRRCPARRVRSSSARGAVRTAVISTPRVSARTSSRTPASSMPASSATSAVMDIRASEVPLVELGEGGWRLFEEAVDRDRVHSQQQAVERDQRRRVLLGARRRPQRDPDLAVVDRERELGAFLSVTRSTTFCVCCWPPKPPFGTSGACRTSTSWSSTRMIGRARPRCRRAAPGSPRRHRRGRPSGSG